MASQLVKQFGPRLLSTATLGKPATEILIGTSTFFRTTTSVVPVRTSVAWIRFPSVGVRHGSTLALNKEGEEKEVKTTSVGGEPEEKAITGYWGIAPSKITKEDGKDWKWTCFKKRNYRAFLATVKDKKPDDAKATKEGVQGDKESGRK
ncbi:ubiquinol oxidase 1, mitochondrial-like [Telopea speciosissima]|uniref:ubiquinol oxidase 1, mitochondrial-like n=1 Tax=Telopea speciosissima TaxID=54955 RepID=UPI001CC45372|nr:ubiquinol oxidase 1, mitochondrial-like [Telopea speciosissima]